MTNISSPLAKMADKFGDAPAIIVDSVTVNYREYRQKVADTIVKMESLGITPGQRVAIIADNSVEYIVGLVALFHLGAIACPISNRHPVDAAMALLNRIGCSDILGDCAVTPYDPSFNYTSLGSLKSSGDAGRELPQLDLDRDASIMFTSGSSDEPKAVLHTLGNHYYNALGSNENIALVEADRWLLVLPLYHVGGVAILFRTLLCGAAVVLPEGKETTSETIKKNRISHMSMVTTQLYRMLREPHGADITAGLKTVLLGGSAIPERLLNAACLTGLPLCTSYGSTEMASQICTTSPSDTLDHLLTSGRPLKYREVRVSDDGEIMVKGKTLFKGYVEGNRLLPAVDDDGWFSTGDCGRFDREGYLVVTGRKDNLIISGGENIQPEEIERLISLVDEVEQVMVVPVPDEEFGARPVAFIKLVEGCRKDVRELIGYLEKCLPRFKIPDEFYPWPEELQPTGLKPDRQSLAKLASEKYRR